jgi:hypothetical protein
VIKIFTFFKYTRIHRAQMGRQRVDWKALLNRLWFFCFDGLK